LVLLIALFPNGSQLFRKEE